MNVYLPLNDELRFICIFRVCPNPGCRNHNFTWRTECKKCGAPKPGGDNAYTEKKIEVGGQWTCVFCKILNAADATHCIQCNSPKAGMQGGIAMQVTGIYLILAMISIMFSSVLSLCHQIFILLHDIMVSKVLVEKGSKQNFKKNLDNFLV